MNPTLTRRFCLAATALALVSGTTFGREFPDNAALARQLRELTALAPDYVRVESAARSLASNDIWFVELGHGAAPERALRPALLLVAGIEGNDLVGTVSVMAWLEKMTTSATTNDAARQLLDSTTIYAWPRLNPDAAENFFRKPRLELATSPLPVDDDHDGLVDEDGPDDLNGDGWITSMRVADREGEWIPDPAEPRLLIKADRTKGEAGAWKIFTEGRDDDGDEAWNEDGPGGVNFNRNFPYNYKFFTAASGRHQISETETRALADFVIAHPNIAVAFTFGAADNLTQPPKGETPKRPPTAVQEEDVAWYRELGKAWREAIGLKKELPGASEAGTFSDWMYFHRGRLSLAARAWAPALAVEWGKGKSEGKPKDAAKEDKPDKADKPVDEAAPDKNVKEKEKEAGAEKPKAEEKKGDARGEDERAFLKWIDQNAPEFFVPWKAVELADFPGRTVEVGGFAPFARSNPPEKLLDELAARHGKFLDALPGKLPRLGLRETKVKALGEGVFDVTVQIENKGFLPTALAQGETTREVNPTRVVLDLDEKLILSGTRRVMVGSIPGSGGMKEVRWVILARGRAQVGLEVISALAGQLKTSVELKEGN